MKTLITAARKSSGIIRTVYSETKQSKFLHLAGVKRQCYARLAMVFS